VEPVQGDYYSTIEVAADVDDKAVDKAVQHALDLWFQTNLIQTHQLYRRRYPTIIKRIA
jgi:hypothetical protein